jgi:hypothetical protein
MINRAAALDFPTIPQFCDPMISARTRTYAMRRLRVRGATQAAQHRRPHRSSCVWKKTPRWPPLTAQSLQAVSEATKISSASQYCSRSAWKWAGQYLRTAPTHARTHAASTESLCVRLRRHRDPIMDGWIEQQVSASLQSVVHWSTGGSSMHRSWYRYIQHWARCTGGVPRVHCARPGHLHQPAPKLWLLTRGGCHNRWRPPRLNKQPQADELSWAPPLSASTPR